MELADNDLLDLLLGRRSRTANLDRPEVREVLEAVRRRADARTQAQVALPAHDIEECAMTPSDVKATLSFSDGSPRWSCRSTRARSART